MQIFESLKQKSLFKCLLVPEILLQPETQLILNNQLLIEGKCIYVDLFMVEKIFIEVDEK